MMPELVHFSSRKHPFRVDFYRCDNLECGCTDVNFRLAEVSRDGNPVPDRLVLEIRVETTTWEEMNAPSRSEEESRIIQEFLADFPPAEKAELQDESREKARVALRLSECRIDPREIQQSRLISFSRLITDPNRRAGLDYVLDRFEHDGIEYVIDDLHCSNPDCECWEAHLWFLRCTLPQGPGGGTLVEERFSVLASLDGAMRVAQCRGCESAEAEAVLSAWQQHHGDDIEELCWRYEKVKEIARRSLPPSTRSSRPSAPSRDYWLSEEVPETASPVPVRAGRNDPCPCGSGKKFKKCCGQNRGVAR